jgi:hypothetical protein
MLDCTDDHKKGRRLHESTRWLHDGLTKGKIAIRIKHENEPSQCLRAIIWHAKDFGIAHEVAARACNIKPGIIRWKKMPSRMARCYNDQTRI